MSGEQSAVKRFEELASQVRPGPSCRRPPAAAACTRAVAAPGGCFVSRQPCRPRLAPQWEKYERKVTERSVEQQTALSRSATGLLDSVRRRLATPAPPAAAADPMATPRAGLIAAVGGSAVPPTTAAASSQLAPAPLGPADTPRAPGTMGAALRESLGAELSRSLGGSATAPLASAPRMAAAAAAAPTPAGFAAAAALSGGGGADSALQQASSLFLQQVEDMRRKHMADVERLKVGWRG